MINNILYINLEKRIDRKKHIEEQLQILKWKGQRFNAYTDPIYSARGCAKSHVGCLELAKEKNWNHILVLEDDVKFTNPELFLIQLNKNFYEKSIYYCFNHYIWIILSFKLHFASKIS